MQQAFITYIGIKLASLLDCIMFNLGPLLYNDPQQCSSPSGIICHFCSKDDQVQVNPSRQYDLSAFIHK